ncbi:conserved Plasmodium protein, unknown function [Plasmodium berghei]|uniref:Uncharacterized protein n=2 Tax=Plasmodium berghei TaxID=5821 RepID=A0A509AGS3_PLABA|nr:conserved Plasmodium protein, unknown function [Plasmodium berghei ANKA]CXH81545.1 conserved Plasmodium protein, unknown function [Plasmodium berghei]SCM19126.1 conserved Plasmodium protein, unknown function [Plasmodium berghei]SCN21608.1 conserved Plasmodium protein, unknown function [Plasmodium berghei]SCO58847.1 conserved Plasmodium protein, unknown function [Plasmodium berghei]SCO58908.1 conserved Plasmodium protein, unknown function [Plasmodium berghei]|eukprot:XP_034419664.1 conserved Plasmodium protein, unknown function [Plasmodium berghei ANKA]
MKKVYCFLYFCNVFFSGTKYNRKTIFNLNIKKIKNIENKYPQNNNNFSHKLYNTDDNNNNYSQFDINRDNEYNEILNDIIYEYEKEQKEKNKGDKISQISEKDGKEKNQNTVNTNNNNNNTYIPKNKEHSTSKDEHNTPLWEKEIERINKLKNNNLLNLCDLNYDFHRLVINTSKVDENNEEENYNKISLFLESQVLNKNKEESNLCIEDSIGRYFLKINDEFIQTISEKELHSFKNVIHKKIIYLKYQYLKKYKSAIDQAKKVSKTKTEEINKHVSLVYEGDENSSMENDDSNLLGMKEKNSSKMGNNNNDNSDNVNNIHINNSEENEMKTNAPELSLEKINEMIDLSQKLSKLQKNFDDLKKFDIFKILNENRFLNNLKIKNFQFFEYSCASLKEDMDQFIKKIRMKKNENEIEESDVNKFCYLSVPKINDMHFLNTEKKTIIIKVPNEEKKEKKILKPVKELNIETDKAILLLSQNDKKLNVSVRSICDKIGYLTQGLCIYPQLDSEINNKEFDNKKSYLKNEKIIKRLLILLIFYFKIKNVYVICMDDISSKLFYNFIKTNNNIFKDFYTYGVEEEKDEESTPNSQKRKYVDLDKITFSHIFNKNFVPLYSIESIIKNYVFILDKDEIFYDISFFKRSCLFMFLNKNLNKQSHVFFSKVQHFAYYKKFDYPYIYNIDTKYSLSTLKAFNEIILYLTTWIDIFNTSETEDLSSINWINENEQEHIESDINNPKTKSDKNSNENYDSDQKYYDEYDTSMENEYSEFDQSDNTDEKECSGEYGENP